MYTALKETETRATDLLPYWKLPLVGLFVPRQRKAAEAVALIRCGGHRLWSICQRGEKGRRYWGVGLAGEIMRDGGQLSLFEPSGAL